MYAGEEMELPEQRVETHLLQTQAIHVSNRLHHHLVVAVDRTVSWRGQELQRRIHVPPLDFPAG